jgi:uncharacterized membrane protein
MCCQYSNNKCHKLIIGILAAHQFKFSGAGASMIGVSAMLGSGAIQMNANGIALKGIGDIINPNIADTPIILAPAPLNLN